MYYNIKVINNINIEFIYIYINITLYQLLAENVGPFGRPENPQNMANPYFEKIKHLQNLVTLTLTTPCIYGIP